MQHTLEIEGTEKFRRIWKVGRILSKLRTIPATLDRQEVVSSGATGSRIT